MGHEGTPLETARLVLRPPVPGDAGWIAREIAHPEVHVMLTAVPHPYGVADAEGWIASNRDVPGVFVIEQDGEPLGALTLENTAWGRELGYWLKRDAWGRGVMSEAAGAALGWHFSQSAEGVPSGHIIGNTSSRNVLLKLGFTDTEIVSRHSHFRGRDVEIQRMILTRAEWESRHGH